MSFSNNGYYNLPNYANMQLRTPSYLPGKIIREEGEIIPQDVPLNGSVAFFPTSDYSCIYAKTWSQTGDRIETRKYVPETNVNNGENKEDAILNALTLLGGQMEELHKEMESMKKERKQRKQNQHRSNATNQTQQFPQERKEN